MSLQPPSGSPSEPSPMHQPIRSVRPRRDSTVFGAIVLTGGTGSRLGGADKASLRLDGATLLEHAVNAMSGAEDVVVVGDPVAAPKPVEDARSEGPRITWTRESPAGGGPAAGLLAGLDAMPPGPILVCVLAVDMPRVTHETVERLIDAVGDRDGAVLVDAEGTRQPLAGVYRIRALQAVRPEGREHEEGLSVKSLVEPLDLVEVAAVGDEARDIDTREDLESLE